MNEIYQVLVVDSIIVGLAVSNALSDGWVKVDPTVAEQVAALGLGCVRFVGGEVVPYQPPPAPTPVSIPTPQLCGLANLKIQNGEITGVETSTGMQMALWLEPGVFWVFFSEPMPDTNYIADASANLPGACVSMRTQEFIEVRVVGLDGATFDPAEVSIRIHKVVL